MPLFAPDDPRPIHFMGIAGAGMSALALIARLRGVGVNGCDIHPQGATALAEAGIEIKPGHSSSHVSDVRAVIYSSAIQVDHEELEAARTAGVPVVRRAEALQEAVEGGKLAAVAGTHGKTTTAAMLTEALAAAGADPTGIVGGRIPAWGGNARPGRSDLFVVEADEYDRSFLALRPQVAVVTNVEGDHLECYGGVDELEAAFAEFAGGAEQVIVGADDAGARRVAERLSVPVRRVGTSRNADVRIERIGRRPEGTRFDLAWADGASLVVELAVPGLHNVRNAAVALAAAAAVGVDPAGCLAGLREFSGVARRFEVLGSARGITVVDDYAHHPTEVAVTVGAARQRFPKARVVAVFQPHLYSRTKRLAAELGITLSAADVVVVTGVFAAREAPIKGVTGKAVASAARVAGVPVEWVPDRARVLDVVAGLVAEGDVVLTIGAGDIGEIGHELLRRLEGRAA